MIRPLTPIAIVGAGCEVPGARNPAELWELVEQGRDAIGDAPRGRWRIAPSRALCSPVAPDPDRSWSTRGGYLEGFEQRFNPDGFAVSAESLQDLDPVFLLPLHCARQALHDAGLEVGALGPRSGALIGNLSFPTAGLSAWAESVWTHGQAANLPPVDPRNRFSSGLPALLLAEAIGLDRGATALDAACASSLYAVALACERLAAGELDFALAGAVNRCDDLFIHVGFCALGAISRKGTSRPFDASADGLLPAEGCAMVALMRLDDALAQGRPVRGVIRGVGLSNDGRGRGFLAPSTRGQVRAMRAALESAQLEPADIGYIECHATGTPVGDATELESLAAVYGSTNPLPIGSLKSNLGHLVTAAGAAGLIKVLAALQHRTLPPTLHVTQPNAAVARTHFVPVAAAAPWGDRPLRAGVSAFGFGGNNAHLIVEATELAAQRKAAPRSAPVRAVPIAVVGLGIVAHEAADAAAFVRRLEAPAPSPANERPATSVSFEPAGLRFPPTELRRSLAQQTFTLRAVLDATAGLDLGEPDRIGVIVGMGADCEVARYGLRWRLDDLGAAGLDRDAIVDPLDADAVVGTMPNIPANRLNRQLDAGAFGFTVSSEQHSGLDALQMAIDALRLGRIDVAVVAAADLSVEPVHVAALGRLEHHVPGDAAVALVLRRADAAHAPLALVDDADASPELDRDAIEARFGHPHAARALLDVAAACVGRDDRRVTSVALGGSRRALTVRPRVVGPLSAPVRGGLLLPAHPPPVVAGVHRLARPPALARTTDPVPSGLGDVRSALATSRHDATPPVGSVALAAVSVNGVLAPAPIAPVPSAVVRQPEGALGPLWAQHQALVAAHRAHLELTSDAYARFQAVRAQAAAVLAAASGAGLLAPPATPFGQDLGATPFGQDLGGQDLGVTAPAGGTPFGQDLGQDLGSDPRRSPVSPRSGAPPAPWLDRSALEWMSRHEISRYFGPEFAAQDGYARQVRMPTPPMLLCDRVERIDAVPRSMGRGTVYTATDVVAEAWFMHQGRMPAGIMIESGQADLLLISYLGIDFLNQGERVYRLLGCELTYSGGLPRPGETLRYDIHVDGHAKHGDVRLFFFHYDCRVDDQPRLTVRNGQAGFFTDAELAESMGVLWEPGDDPPPPSLVTHAPPVPTLRTTFDRAAIEAFAAGEVVACFGPAHARAHTHTRTPTIAGGRMNLLGDSVELDFAGGPWKRGYLRAVDAIAPDDWFFDGHFHNDPCMPGTLMFEGCLQAMAFYMAAAGLTLGRDGWVFEPVPDVTYPLRCRGQVIPSSTQMVTELFVRELRDGDVPVLVADLLCTVDGLKAFHCRAMGLQLVPGWPQSTLPTLPVSSRPVARIGALQTDENAMIASALGMPTAAFGSLYADFAPHRRIPRLPGPPYLFITRIASIEGEVGSMRAGAGVVAEYDITGNEWYFAESPLPDRVRPAAVMPYAVLVEAALQPCGWLASFLGGARVSAKDLLFRNLDGTGVLRAQIPARPARLTTTVRCTRWSRSGETVICAFDVSCDLDNERVYDLQTVFGFFTPEALATQVGLPPLPAHQAILDAPGLGHVLRQGPVVTDARVDATGSLRLLDRIVVVPSEGPVLLRGEKDVQPAEWFFKAHFFQDPVMPGSLGLEQMEQALQWYLTQRPEAATLVDPVFDAIGTGAPFVWRYRGQVIPERRITAVTLEVREVHTSPDSVSAVADASLWVDGLRIYEGRGLTAVLRSRA